MPSKLDDCIALREVHLYRGQPLETQGRGGYAGVDGLTIWRRGWTASGGVRGRP
jgi:hypothetical protein